MILYDFVPAPNPRRVRIFLHEKGIEVPTKQIDIMKGEHKKKEYKKAHITTPNCAPDPACSHLHKHWHMS